MGYFHKLEDFPEIPAPYLMAKFGKSPLGRVFASRNIMVSMVKGPAGMPPFMHHHEAEQITIFYKGKMKCFMKDMEPKILGAGDIWIVPSNVSHGGEILEDSDISKSVAPFAWICWVAIQFSKLLRTVTHT